MGNFESYGITNTVDYAQANSPVLTTEETNAYLYFDDVHNTESGQAMTAQALALTLESNREAIAAAPPSPTRNKAPQSATSCWLPGKTVSSSAGMATTS